MKGKIIALEGTDGSGKGYQTLELCRNLSKNGIKNTYFRFPDYVTPTGQIIGECLLGMDEFGDNPWFDQPSKVDPLVASAYYAADRRYNIGKILDKVNDGYTVVLDRYVFSNMAHQGGKIEDKVQRLQLYKKLELLEFTVMDLPYPDDTYFLSMPYEQAEKLRQKRGHMDYVERDKKYLLDSERAYNELTDLYGFVKIDCIKDGEIRKPEDIGEEVISKVLKRSFNR